MTPDAPAPSVGGFLHEVPSRETATARLIRWLSRHRVWLSIFTLVYFTAVVTLHDLCQQPAYWVQGQLQKAAQDAGKGTRNWNNLVTAVSVPLLAAFVLWMLAKLRRHPRYGIAAMYLAVTAGLSVLFFHTLFCMNIEAIHYPQYAVLGVLLFALTGSFGQTIIWGTLCGLIDEGYQYFYLYSHRGWIYMDFNDVILNTVGVGFGLVMLYIGGVHAVKRRLFTSAAVVAVAALTTAGVALYSGGLLRLLPAADAHPWTIVLRRCGPSKSFWNPMKWGKTFHEVQPMEWVVASIVLIAFYAILDRVRPAKGKP